MTLDVPKLDDRTFQNIVDEARKRIPYYCQEWTDNNISDPGITLIELFAWMTEMLLYRLNQVPDLHYIKFMEMLGIRRREPMPAKAQVTFFLSAPQNIPVVIRAGTEVASTQTEMQRSIVFETDDELHIDPPQFSVAFSLVGPGKDKSKIAPRKGVNPRELEAGIPKFEVFSSVPVTDDAFYLGFENDLSFHLLGLQVDFDHAGGVGIDITQPPCIWEVSPEDPESRWEKCDLEEDTTKGMEQEGSIKVHIPKMRQCTFDGRSLYWLRARVIMDKSSPKAADGMKPYDTSPRLRRLSVASWGGTTTATHSHTVEGEVLGRSDGSTGQRFQLQFSPVLQRQGPNETLIVQEEGKEAEHWREVSDFADSGQDNRIFTLDSLTGELRLGPAIRQPNGETKLFGAVPPRGANLIFGQYRYGGGIEGNVPANFLNTCKTSIPYVDKVSNGEAAKDGLDAETLASAMLRAPALLRSRERAVTAADFEFLAKEASHTAIGRVKCFQPPSIDDGRIPGVVHVLLIPNLDNSEKYHHQEELTVKPEALSEVKAYLDDRRLLTTRLEVHSAQYQWVAARVRLHPVPGANLITVEKNVADRLYRFINPLTGGPDEKGWPFGRAMFVSDVYQSLQDLPDVQFIRSVQIYKTTPGGSIGEGNAVDPIGLLDQLTIASGKHVIELE